MRIEAVDAFESVMQTASTECVDPFRHTPMPWVDEAGSCIYCCLYQEARECFVRPENDYCLQAILKLEDGTIFLGAFEIYSFRIAFGCLVQVSDQR